MGRETITADKENYDDEAGHLFDITQVEPYPMQVIREHYRDLSQCRIDEILQADNVEDHTMRIRSLLARHDGDFSAEQIDKIIAAACKNIPDYYYACHKPYIVYTLTSKWGDKLLPVQIEKLVDGCMMERIHPESLMPLIRQHDRDLSAQINKMLEMGQLDDSDEITIINQYGNKLLPERISEIIDKLAETKQEKGRRLEASIEWGHEFDSQPLPANMKYAREEARAEFLDKHCKEIQEVLSSIIEKVPNLESTQIDSVIETGDSSVHAQLINHKAEFLSLTQRYTILSKLHASLERQIITSEYLNSLAPEWQKKLVNDNLLAMMIEKMSSVGTPEQRSRQNYEDTDMITIIAKYIQNFSPKHMDRLVTKDYHVCWSMIINRCPEKFSPVHIDQLIEKGHQGTLLGLLGKCPDRLSERQVAEILEKKAQAIGSAWIHKYEQNLQPEHVKKMIEVCNAEVVSALVRLCPDKLPPASIEDRIDLLLEKCKDSFWAEAMLEEYGPHFSTEHIEKLLTGDPADSDIREYLLRNCQEKLSPTHIDQIILGDYRLLQSQSSIGNLLIETHRERCLHHLDKLLEVDSPLLAGLIQQYSEELSSEQVDMIMLNSKCRSKELLLKTHRERCLHNLDKLLEVDSPLLAGLIQQYSEELSSEQISKLIEKGSYFVRCRLVDHCGTRFESEQISKFLDAAEKESDPYDRAEPPVHENSHSASSLRRLIDKQGHNMLPEQLDRLIRYDCGGHLAYRLLEQYPMRLSSKQTTEIAERFGYLLSTEIEGE